MVTSAGSGRSSGLAGRIRAWSQINRQALAVTVANRDILRVQVAYLSVFAASAMLLVALSIVAFERAGAAGVAALTLAQMLPTLLIVPLVSGMGARLPRRRLLLGALMAGAAGAAGTAVLLVADSPLEGLFVVAAVIAAAAGVTWAVTTALLPALARSPEELIGANVASTAVEGMGGLVGPLLATVLLVLGGPALVAGVAVVVFLLGLVAAVGVHAAPSPLDQAVTPRQSGARALFTEAGEGIRILWQLPGPRLVTVGIVVQTFVRGALGVLIVVLAIDVLGTGDPGVALLTAAMGFGGLVGSGLAAGLTVGRPLGPLLAISLACWGLPIALIAPLPTAAVALMMLAVVGASNALVDVSGFGLLQGSIPDQQRTGALGAVRAAVSLGVAAGGVAASVLLSLAGVQVVLVIVGLLLPALVLVLWPRWRTLDDRLLVSREQVEAIRRCPIFAPLTLAQLEQLAGGMHDVRFAAGEAIIKEGEPGDAFYIITRGDAQVSSAGTSLNTLRTGDSFGEIALVRGVPRTATVTATSPLDAYRIDAPTFVSAITGNPSSRAAADEVISHFEPLPG